MKALTKEQKIEAYRHAREQIMISNGTINGSNPFVCDHLKNWIDDFYFPHSIKSDEQLHKLLPEFAAFNTHSGTPEWWPLNAKGRQTRIDILTKIINELENGSL